MFAYFLLSEKVAQNTNIFFLGFFYSFGVFIDAHIFADP